MYIRSFAGTFIITPPKLEDPGTPKIMIQIGSHKFFHAILDSGSSLNVLSFEMYQNFGFKGMIPTDGVIQMADNSVVYPRGIMPNVVLRVGDFYYTVDFTNLIFISLFRLLGSYTFS